MGMPLNNKGEYFAESIKGQTLLGSPTGKGASVDWVPFVTNCRMV